jgi:segregation and condensation protein B
LPAGLPVTIQHRDPEQSSLSLCSVNSAADEDDEEEDKMQTKPIVEAILFAADRPMTLTQIQQVFPELEQPDIREIQAAIEEISADYLHRPITLKQLASGYRFQVREGLAYWVSRLFEEKPARYSRALLETLAIIAYRQPVTRGDIEEIRGVAVSTSIIHTLLDREWVKVIGHKEVPGRPALYSTTRQFLDYFNLRSLAELPSMEELVNLDLSNALQQQLQQEQSERPQTNPSAIGSLQNAGPEAD